MLQKDGGSPAFILTVDGATKNFTVRKVGAAAEPGKSFELWLISDKLPQPRSLGVIGGSDFTARPVLSSYDADTINAATYAVTVEQAGGSPDGKPHSAPVFAGKLIETVPPAAPAPSPAAIETGSASNATAASRAGLRPVRPAKASRRPKRKRPWGAGVFGSVNLGVVGVFYILTWRLWGAGKEPREFTKSISAPSTCPNLSSSPPCRP